MASQVLAVKEQMTQSRLSIAVMKQVIEAQKQMADMLAKNAAVIRSAEDAGPGGFSTYA
jgi:hypothetical protein